MASRPQLQINPSPTIGTISGGGTLTISGSGSVVVSDGGNSSAHISTAGFVNTSSGSGTTSVNHPFPSGGTIIVSGTSTTLLSNYITNTLMTANGTVGEPQPSSYDQLNHALVELHSLDDDWKIQTPVYSASVQVAAILVDKNIPQPAVFTHGPKSVVFNWTAENTNLYLTVSKSKLSVLVSSPAGIEFRTDLSPASDNTERFFSALGASKLTLTGPSEPLIPTGSAEK